MNSILKVNSYRIFTALLLLCCMQLFESCSKKKDDLPVPTGEIVKLRFEISDVIDGDQPLASANNTGLKYAEEAATKNDGVLYEEKLNFNGIDALFTVEKDTRPGLLEINPKSVNTKVSANPVKTQEATNVGVKYRLVLYYEQNGVLTFANSILATSGFPTEMDVVKGKSYKWIAYSYNNTDDVPEINEADPNIETPIDKELLYAASSSPIVPKAARTPIGIMFKRKLSRVGVEIDASPRAATISSVTAKFKAAGYFKKGVLNLKTGIVTPNVTGYNSVDINFVDPVPANAAKKVAYFYTADPNSIANFGITITGLTIVSSGVSKTLVTSANPKDMDYPDFVPSTGTKLTARVRLLPENIVIAGTTWATGNLYYKDGKYGIHPNDVDANAGEAYNKTDYWYWKSLTPTDQATIKTVDPCTKVLPLGTWRLPTKQDFQYFLDNKNSATYFSSGQPGTSYVRFPDGKGNMIQFNIDGFYQGFQEDSFVNGTFGYYWVSDPGNSSFSFYAGEAFRFYTSPSLVNYWPNNQNNQRMKIRCVKN